MDALNYEFMVRQKAMATLERVGVSVDVMPYCPDLIEEVAATKGRVGPEVRCCGDPDSGEDATLIVLRNEGQEIVGFSAVKICATRGRSLDQYLFDTYRHQYAGGQDPFDLHDLPDIVREVRGRIAYVGDFWLSSKKRINITALAMLSLLTAHRDLDADAHYFFTRNKNDWRGLTARYMAVSRIAFAIDWNMKVDHRLDTDCMYVTRRDEAYRIERKYVKHFGPNGELLAETG